MWATVAWLFLLLTQSKSRKILWRNLKLAIIMMSPPKICSSIIVWFQKRVENWMTEDLETQVANCSSAITSDWTFSQSWNLKIHIRITIRSSKTSIEGCRGSQIRRRLVGKIEIYGGDDCSNPFRVIFVFSFRFHQSKQLFCWDLIGAADKFFEKGWKKLFTLFFPWRRV